MKVGIIRYPGSNCDYDMLNYFDDSFFIWHTDTELPKMDLLIIPGGFAFGDRIYDSATSNYEISPGEMAVNSPVTKIIMSAVDKNIPIVGICNGFQILIQLGLLPGKLLLNNNSKFNCKVVKCHLESKFLNEDIDIDIPIANSYGRYFIEYEEYLKLVKNEQIFLKYKNYNNGSYQNIAGVCNNEYNIYGMMPHPERSKDSYFKKFFSKLVYNELSKNIEKIMCSEHVSYKSTSKYLSKLYTEGSHVVQGPGENAGIVRIGNGYCIAVRIESHNHPVFINPYQGAATGVGGILRDIFTMGARPIALLDFLRFGKDEYNSTLIPKTIKGISDYGNCVGVPNIGGDFYRSEIYNKNPLVNVACIGIVKESDIIYGNALNKDSVIIYVGSKTGREGVGGADMASKSFTGNIDNLKDNIQTGDPFLGKLLLEACNEIAVNNLAEGMQDLGAGGILCATVEVVERGRKKTGKGLGCTIFLDKVPKKYSLTHSEILISESQERMIIIAESSNREKIFNIFKKWDLEYSEIGLVTENDNYTVCDENRVVYRTNFGDFNYPKIDWDENDFKYSRYSLEKIKDKKLWEEYDSMVGCRTINGPLDDGSFAILDIFETGEKLVVTWGSNFTECYNQMMRQNAKPLGLVNCLNFGHPDKSMGAFKTLLEDLNYECIKNKLPVLGGNVSLYNSTNDISIDPTIVLVMIGVITY